MAKDIILSIKNASYRYNDAAEDEYALKDVSFDFESGKVYAIRGRSGSGKTTLLSLISGLERATEGDIIFDGKSLKVINLDTYRNSHIGIVFQSYNLIPHQTVLGNVELSLELSGVNKKERRQRALELLKKVASLCSTECIVTSSK